MEEYRTMRETIRKAMQENVKGTKEEVERAVEAVTDAVMEAIADGLLAAKAIEGYLTVGGMNVCGPVSGYKLPMLIRRNWILWIPTRLGRVGRKEERN